MKSFQNYFSENVEQADCIVKRKKSGTLRAAYNRTVLTIILADEVRPNYPLSRL